MIDHGFRSAARILHIGEPMEKDCLFCKIIRGEKPAEFLYQDESLVVFRDIYPGAPVHLLVVPKKHIRSLNDITEQDERILSENDLESQRSSSRAGSF